MVTSDRRQEGLLAVISGIFMAILAGGAMAQSRSETKRIKRSMRRGSLAKVSSEGVVIG